MQWWNDFVDWLTSEDGWRILTTVVFPLLAIIVAGFIAAVIGRGSTKRLITLHERERRIATVSALIGAARRASKYNTLSLPEQEHADHLAHDADVSTRLLPLPGASMTADWAAHEIAEMKKNSVSFSFQAEQSLMDFRDRLVEWQARPSRAKKLFKADLDLWAYESAQEDKGLVEKQQEWAKQQLAAETGPVTTVAPSVDVPAAVTASSASSPVTPTSQPAAAETPTVSSSYLTPSSTAAVPTAGDEPAATTGEQVEVEMPNPVSAQTVRQRVLPDYEDDDLR